MGYSTTSEQRLFSIASGIPVPANEQMITFRGLFSQSLIKKQRLLKAFHIVFEIYFLTKHTVCVKEGNISLVILLETPSISKIILANSILSTVRW